MCEKCAPLKFSSTQPVLNFHDTHGATINMYWEDCYTIAEGNCVSDVMMQFGIATLYFYATEYVKQAIGCEDHYIMLQFHNMLQAGLDEFPFPQTAIVERFLTKRFIAIPMLRAHHWTLLAFKLNTEALLEVMTAAASPGQLTTPPRKTIVRMYVYDSNVMQDSEGRSINSNFHDQLARKFVTTMLRYKFSHLQYSDVDLAGRFGSIEYRVYEPEIPQQKNGSDCGVYVLKMFALLMTSRISLASPENVPRFEDIDGAPDHWRESLRMHMEMQLQLHTAYKRPPRYQNRLEWLQSIKTCKGNDRIRCTSTLTLAISNVMDFIDEDNSLFVLSSPIPTTPPLTPPSTTPPATTIQDHTSPGSVEKNPNTSFNSEDDDKETHFKDLHLLKNLRAQEDDVSYGQEVVT